MRTSEALLGKELLRSLEQVKNGRFESLFFMYSHPEDFRLMIDRFVKPALPEAVYFEADLSETQARLPLFPILNFLQRATKDLSQGRMKELFRKAGVYPFHVRLLMSLLKTGNAARREELFLFEAEILFEVQTLQGSLWRLLAALYPDRPLVLILDQFHKASESVIRLFGRLLQTVVRGRVLILSGYAEVPFLKSGFPRPFLDFLSAAEYNGRILEIPESLTLASKGLVIREAPAPRQWSEFLQRGANALRVLAFEESLRDLREAQEILEEENLALPFELTFALGTACAYQSLWDEALVHLNLALTEAQKNKTFQEIILAGQLLSFVYFKKKDTFQAAKLIQQSLKLAREIDDDPLFARVMIFEKYYHQEEPDPEKNLREYEMVLQALDRAGFRNSVTIVESLTTYVKTVAQVKGWQEALSLCENAMKKAARWGNLYRVSVLLHTLGYLYEMDHQRAAALGCFRRSIRLRKRLGHPIELIKVLNGTGYFCFAGGDFKEALRFFERGLRLLEHNKDYEEICLTLFNIGIVYFTVRDFAPALLFFESILRIMDEMKIRQIPWHTRRELYSLAGLCCYKEGRLVRGLDYHHKAGQDSDGAEDSPPYLFLDLLLSYETTGEIDTGLAYRGALDSCLKEPHPYLFYLLKMEVARILDLKGRHDAAVRELTEGQVHASQQNQVLFEGLFSRFRDAPPLLALTREPFFPLRRIEFDTNFITELARKDADLNQLHLKIQEIHFLNSLQGILLKNSPHQLVDDLMTLLRSNFASTVNVLIHESPGQSPEVLYPRRVEQEQSLERLLEWIGPLLSVRETVYLPPGDPRLPSGTSSLMFLPLASEGLVLATKDTDHTLSWEDFRILSLAGKQISLAFELRRANEKLLRAATTDGLTGLYNRQELHKKLVMEKKRLLRYHNNKQNRFSLIFIDLDNFKFYNDSFGHMVGDMLLRLFAQILKNATREVDVVGRYGGDEFILLLPETSLEGALVVADRIFKDLDKSIHFQSEIESFLGRPVDIPEERRITCSIGISAFNADVPLEIEELITRADEALYHAKRSGKNQVVVA